MKYTLRKYQQESANTAVWYLRKYGKPFIIQAATGAGKSLIIADICHQIDEPILILQPSKEILEQNYAKLLSYHSDIEKDIGIYSASKNRKEIAKFTYATIGSIYKKPELFKHFKYVIIDECHGVDPKNFNGMYKTFLDAIGCTRVCGLTATPYRLVQKYVREGGQMYYTATLKMINRIYPYFFKKIVYQIETEQLISEGFLCPIKYYASSVDWSQLTINSTGADFTQESVERFWNESKISRICKAVDYALATHERCLVFCSSLRQANAVLKRFEGSSSALQLVDGKTPKLKREAAIAAFKSGEKPIMLNVGVFTTGFDVPELDCIVLARPTMSLSLYYQMVGRGVRLDDRKPAKILHVYDLAGVVERLGRVETIKIVKEKEGYRDQVMSEVGRMDETGLFKFMVKKKVFKEEEQV